jgi:hypothetical protein
MSLAALMLLAGTPQAAPLLHRQVQDLPAGQRHMSDFCDTGVDGWTLSPVSLQKNAGDAPESYGDGDDGPLDQTLPDDGYAPDGYPPDDGYAPDDGPEEEQCPMIFVIPFDFWDGQLWFDASAYGPQV